MIGPQTQATATYMEFSNQDDSGTSVKNFMTSISNVQSNPKGHVLMSLKGDPAVFLLFQIVTIVFNTAADSWRLTGTVQSASAAPSPYPNNPSDVLLSFTMVGTKGDQGDIGPQGPQGIKGDQGDIGPQGIQGVKGDQGDPGLKGDQGDPGPQGLQGIQGLKGDQGDPGVKRGSR